MCFIIDFLIKETEFTIGVPILVTVFLKAFKSTPLNVMVVIGTQLVNT